MNANPPQRRPAHDENIWRFSTHNGQKSSPRNNRVIQENIYQGGQVNSRSNDRSNGARGRGGGRGNGGRCGSIYGGNANDNGYTRHRNENKDNYNGQKAFMITQQ